MKKKVSYLFGTIVSLLASVFSSATASACGGGDMGYIPPKSYKDEKSYTDEKSYVDTKPSPIVTTLQNGKSTTVITSYLAEKSYSGSKVFIDGVEMTATALPKANTSEQQRILRAAKEGGCLAEAKVKAVFKKYGFKTDDKSMNALEAKYSSDTAFMSQVEKAIQSCGGASY